MILLATPVRGASIISYKLHHNFITLWIEPLGVWFCHRKPHLVCTEGETLSSLL